MTYIIPGSYGGSSYTCAICGKSPAYQCANGPDHHDPKYYCSEHEEFARQRAKEDYAAYFKDYSEKWNRDWEERYKRELAEKAAEEEAKRQKELAVQQKKDEKERQKEQDRLDRIERQERLDEQREADRRKRDAESKAREIERLEENLRKEREEKYARTYEQAHVDHEIYLFQEARTPKPFVFPSIDLRMAGCWCLGNSGKGKTKLLHCLAHHDATHSDASLLLVDNKHDFVAPLKTWAHIQDRLVLIEPKNDFLLALNPLDIPNANINHVVELIDHLLSSLLDSGLSGAQTIFFRNVVPALYDVFQHPAFSDLITVIKSGLTSDQLLTLYDKCDARNDFDSYTFFEDRQYGFHSKTFEATRNAVVWRLDALFKASPIFKNMFNAPKTKLDLSALFAQKKIIIIDADEKELGVEGAQFFQRYILALVYMAAQQRSGASYKHPTFCYFDECAWIKNDTRVPLILDRARSQRIGCTFAHQRLDNIKSGDVLSALKGCPIRYVNVDSDKADMSRFMEVPPELLNLPIGIFSATYRGQLPPTLLKVPFIDWARYPTADPARVRQKSHELYCYTPTQVARPPRPSGPPPNVKVSRYQETSRQVSEETRAPSDPAPDKPKNTTNKPHPWKK